MSTRPTALSIAGSDPSGGAGVQADLKTFQQHQVYGSTVITLLTVQNTQGVTNVQSVDPTFVVAQLSAVLDDVPPQALKTGALGNAEIVRAVAARIRAWGSSAPLVVDPVMISKHGHALLDAAAQGALTQALLPLAYLVTPNTAEAQALSGLEVRTVKDSREAAKRIHALGALAVLVKGGHLEGDPVDVLWHEGEFTEFTAARLDTKHTHGTGCTLSAAITARLARGEALVDAVRKAKRWVHEAIRTAPQLGAGVGPVNHLVPVE